MNRFKKSVTICATFAIAFGLLNMRRATAEDFKLELTNLVTGAFTYDSNGNNVVTSGTAFYDTLKSDPSTGNPYLGTPKDEYGNAVSGDFGIYGVFEYSNYPETLAWISSNGNQLLDIAIVANALQIDTDRDGTIDFTDRFCFDAEDFGLANFSVTFNDLAAQGYTELTEGIWFDIYAGEDIDTGKIALGIVIEDFSHETWDTFGGFDANLLAGALGEGEPGVRRDSGIYLTAVPEPGTLVLLAFAGLAALAAARFRRK